MGLLGCQLRHSISFRQMFQSLHHSYQIARGRRSATSGVGMVMQSFVQGLRHTEKQGFALQRHVLPSSRIDMIGRNRSKGENW